MNMGGGVGSWKERRWCCVCVCVCAQSQCIVMEQQNYGSQMGGGDKTGCSRH